MKIIDFLFRNCHAHTIINLNDGMKKVDAILCYWLSLQSNEIYRSNNDFDADSTLPCSKCGKVDVHVGFGGLKNLEIHQTSKNCKTQACKNTKPKATFSYLQNFFGTKVPKDPPTVSAPPMVHVPPLSESAAIPDIESVPLQQDPPKAAVLEHWSSSISSKITQEEYQRHYRLQMMTIH